MALAGGNIVDARIVTTTDGMALDTFWVQDSDRSAYDDEVRVARDARSGRADASRASSGPPRRWLPGATGRSAPTCSRSPPGC